MKVFEFTTVILSHTKIPNPGSLKRPNKKCFPARELLIKKNYFIGILFLHRFEIFESNLKMHHQKL
jgi:hypothetical protein